MSSTIAHSQLLRRVPKGGSRFEFQVGSDPPGARGLKVVTTPKAPALARERGPFPGDAQCS
jgi:hypothetical protein